MFNWLWNSKKKEKSNNSDKLKKEKEADLTTILLTTDEVMDRKELGIEPESDSIFSPFDSGYSYDSSNSYDSNDTTSTSDDYDNSDSNYENY